jgi:hypothetical protein
MLRSCCLIWHKGDFRIRRYDMVRRNLSDGVPESGVLVDTVIRRHRPSDKLSDGERSETLQEGLQIRVDVVVFIF